MTTTQLTKAGTKRLGNTKTGKRAAAAGLFGYSILDGRFCSFKPVDGYLRDMEQMPHFSPPSPEKFAKQFIASNIRQTHRSS